MLTKPKLEYKNEQYYAAIPIKVSVPFGKILPPLWNEVGVWLRNKNLSPVGTPFVRYLTTDMRKKLDIMVGFPIPQQITGDTRVLTGVLSAGMYATLVYTGPYENEGIVMATASLLRWGAKNNLVWETTILDGNESWEARLEHYLTNPEEETDSRKWRTEIAILTRKTK